MYRYYYAKIWKLICYFDEFRRYTSPGQIYRDLKETIWLFAGCLIATVGFAYVGNKILKR